MKGRIIKWVLKNNEVELIEQINVAKFYEKHQDEILKIQSNKRHVDWKENCEFLISIINPKTGKEQNYYKFKSSDLIPVFRYGIITDWLIQNGKKLTKDEQKKLVDGLVTYAKKMVNVFNEKKRVEYIDKIFYCAAELQGRHDEIMFHPEIMLDLVAYSIIREDENPGEINEVIHAEKKEIFKTEGGAIPFYLQVGLGELYPNWRGSMSESKLLLEANQSAITTRNLIYEKIVGPEAFTETDKFSKTG